MKHYNLFEALHYFHQAEVQAILNGCMTELSFYPSCKYLELRVFCDVSKPAPDFLCLHHLDLTTEVNDPFNQRVCYAYTIQCSDECL